MGRIGQGYDLHRLVEGRDLIIGGIKIPYYKGLSGHSDADVLTHAIIDAILGAMGEKDIGTMFPDNDPKYKDANSLELLACVIEKLHDCGYWIENIDSTVICEKPKLAPHIDNMKLKLARVLKIDTNRINIKAKTNEEQDSMGRGESIAALAVALLG